MFQQVLHQRDDDNEDDVNDDEEDCDVTDKTICSEVAYRCYLCKSLRLLVFVLIYAKVWVCLSLRM